MILRAQIHILLICYHGSFGIKPRCQTRLSLPHLHMLDPQHVLLHFGINAAQDATSWSRTMLALVPTPALVLDQLEQVLYAVCFSDFQGLRGGYGLWCRCQCCQKGHHMLYMSQALPVKLSPVWVTLNPGPTLEAG